MEDFFQWYWTEQCDEDIEMYNRRLNTPAKGRKQVDQFIESGANYTKPDAPLDEQYKVTYSSRSAHGVEEFSSRTVRNVAQHWDDTPNNTKRQLKTFEASYVASGTVCFFLLTVYSHLFRTKLPKQLLQAHHSKALAAMIEFQAAQSESNEINTVLKGVPARDTTGPSGASTIGNSIERFATHCLADLLNCVTRRVQRERRHHGAGAHTFFAA